MKLGRSAAMLAFGVGLVAQASAQSCPSGAVLVADAQTLLAGKTVCAARAPDTWQEFHQSGGTLIDYKKGPSDPVDPTAPVGSWSASATAGTVTYNYTGDGTYTYSVCSVGGTYTFVSATAGTISGITLLPSQGPCP